MKFKHIPAFLMGGTFAVMASISMAQAEKLVISNWDGYMPKDIAEKFKAETGIDLEVAVHATNEEIMGKVTASGGEGFDVLFVSSPFAEALNKLDLLAPIDPCQDSQSRQSLPRSDPVAARSRQHLLGSLRLGHHRPLLPLRPGEGRAHELERPSHARPMTSRARSPCWRPTAG